MGGEKYLESVTRWKGRILVVKMIIFFIKKHIAHASLLPSHLQSPPRRILMLVAFVIVFNPAGAGMGKKLKDSANNFMHSTKTSQFQKLLSL